MEQLVTILAENDNIFYILIIFFTLFYFLSFPFRNSKIYKSINVDYFVSLLPTIVATIGVLGTFIGIAYGLLFFDENNLESSIIDLLAGLKIAFYTSILGIIASIVMKLFKIDEFKQSEEDLSLDILQELKKMNEFNLNNEGNFYGNISESLKKLDKLEHIDNNLLALKNDLIDTKNKFFSANEYTNNIIIDFKNEVIKNNSNIIDKIDKFTQELQQQSVDAIIKALEEVVKDFNENLTEQFGENFKELNRAVTSLVDWQDNYRKIIEETNEELNIILESMNKTAEVSSYLINAIDRLNPTIEMIYDNQIKIELVLNEVKRASEELSIHVPEINKNMKEQTERFNLSIEKFVSEIENAVNYNQEIIKGHIEKIDTIINELTMNLIKSVESSTEKMHNDITEITKSMERSFNKRIEDLDQALETELSNALNALSDRLAKLSDKFANDYEPLTERLRDIIRIAERSEAS